MQHSWQKMCEIMISLSCVTNWIGNIDLLNSLIRMTGCLFSCKTEHERLRLQNIVKEILFQGNNVCWFVYVFVFWCACWVVCLIDNSGQTLVSINEYSQNETV